MEVKEVKGEVREFKEVIEAEEGVREFKEVIEVKAVCFAKYRRSSVPLDNTAQSGSLRIMNYEFLIMNWTI
mgnify:FL=1